MHGYHGHLESETTGNTLYRKVIYTAKFCQLVLMSLPEGEMIGEEIHEGDQFLRFESGTGKVIIDGNEYEVRDGDAVIVPAGAKHNVLNTGTAPLTLYTLYAPPHHKDGTIHKTKADEQEEAFDGQTTES
jgi:mannose-6-phosphate isomerase-like protein (cupin superfamily)